MHSEQIDLRPAWEWARSNTGISSTTIDRHLDNLTNKMNEGKLILPTIHFDTQGTLEGNTLLYQFGEAMKKQGRETIVFSGALNYACRCAENHAKEQKTDPWPYMHKNKVLDFNNFNGSVISEMWIDDDAKKYYSGSPWHASLVEPTWNDTLIRFPD